MVEKKKKHYFLASLDSLDLNHLTVRDLYETTVKGLRKKTKYASMVAVDGTHRAEIEGFKPEDLTDEDFIEVLDEDGELDVDATAKKVVLDFLTNHALLIMRYEEDMYNFVDADCKKWIDRILKGNNNDKGCCNKDCDKDCDKKL